MYSTSEHHAFFGRAKEEARRYGSDPWIFLRELVQNSRDALATEIRFYIVVDNTDLQIVCDDNGHGMSAAEMEDFLFRLYASNKEDDHTRVGCFGVGFWSILAFDPDWVKVDSVRDGHETNCKIDCRAETVVSCGQAGLSAGTRITIGASLEALRQKRIDPNNLNAQLRHKLIEYAAHVRPHPDRKQLNLYHEDVRLNRDFPEPEVITKHIEHKRFNGVVGFGRKPAVALFKAGITVKRVVALKELLPSKQLSPALPQIGLYPVVYINSDELDLLMDRKTVCENPLLQEIVTVCHRTLLQLQARLLSAHLPLGISDRIALSLLQMRLGIGKIMILSTILLLFLGIAYFQPWLAIQSGEAGMGGLVVDHSDDTPQTYTIDRAVHNWGGSKIDPEDGPAIHWDISYSGVEDITLQLHVLSIYDPQRGLILPSPGIVAAYPQAPQLSTGIVINMNLSGVFRRTILPTRPGKTIIPYSLKISGNPSYQLGLGPNQGTVLELKDYEPRRIQYELSDNPPPDFPPTIGGAPTQWPEPYAGVLKEITPLSTIEKVFRLAALVQDEIKYSRSPEDVDRFNQAGGDWVTRAITGGAGDCDVMNGLFALLLRSAQVPAHVGIGLIGENGKIHSELHAWTRYYDSGWQTLDVSATQTNHPTIALSSDRTEFPTSAVGPETLPQSDPAPPTEQNAEATAMPRETPANLLGLSLQTSLYLLIGLLFVPMLLFLRKRFSSPVTANVELPPEYLADIFKHILEHQQERDLYHLRRRPLFHVHGGKRVSLLKLEALAARNRLYSAPAGSPFITLCGAKQPILDQSCTHLRQLAPYLPEITNLSEFEILLRGAPTPVLPARIQLLIQNFDKDFRIHYDPNSNEIREIEIHIPTRGKRHIVIGGRLLSTTGNNESLFHTVNFEAERTLLKLVLSRTTLYLPIKNKLLAFLPSIK